jgi:CubicO group peptidase (beta-lactamase class C family)
MLRRRLFTVSLALLPAPLLAIAACGGSPTPPAGPESELTQDALDAVAPDPGAPREELARKVDALFTREDVGETRAVIVMHDGKIVAERYGQGYSEETRFVSWSMAKTVTGVMIGELVADGKLQLDGSPPIPKWQRPGDPRGEITLRQLLQMRSGLRHTETGEPAYDADTVRMLFLQGRDDMAAWAEAQPLEAEPGRKFEYSTPTSVVLADIAARVLTDSADPDTRRKAVDDFLKTRLFDPLEMYSMVPEYDSSGTLIGGSLINGTARDWAKFGEFLRNGGSVKGAQLVHKGWIEFMTSPSPRARDYGAQVWLNRPSGTDSDVLFADRGPASLFAMIGHLGQYVLVSPSQRLTVVRLGKTNDDIRGPLVDLLGDLVALYPED